MGEKLDLFKVHPHKFFSADIGDHGHRQRNAYRESLVALGVSEN